MNFLGDLFEIKTLVNRKHIDRNSVEIYGNLSKQFLL
jgi:hypothetical protein